MSAGYLLSEQQIRASRADAQWLGMPVAGGSVAFTGTDATVTLQGGSIYMLQATQDCWINIGATAAAGSIMFIKSANVTPYWVQLGPTGTSPVLHVVQSSAGGNLYWTRMDDVW